MKKTSKPRRSKTREAKKECFFCKEKKTPSFLEYELLSRFTSERGKIFARSKSGACSKHQRGLTSQIKKARYLAFLPFVASAE